MVIVINAVVAAATVAILCSGLLRIEHVTAQLLGGFLGVVFVVAAMSYQWRRLQGQLRNAPASDSAGEATRDSQ